MRRDNFRKEFINILLKIAKKYPPKGQGSIVSLLQNQPLKRWPNLSEILKGIDWAVIGAVGLRLYIPQRETADLDIAINKDDASKVRKRLSQAGFKYKGELSIKGSTWISKEGIPIDVIELGQSWAKKAISLAKENRDPQGLPIMPFEYFILIKFTSGRTLDIADITRMLSLADEEKIKKVYKVFKEYLPSDIEDLESLVYLSQLEKEK